MVELPDGVQQRSSSTHVKKLLDRSNAPEYEMSLSPPFSNSSTEHQPQPIASIDEVSRDQHMMVVFANRIFFLNVISV